MFVAVVEPSTGLSNGLRWELRRPKAEAESENAEAESETGTVGSKPFMFVVRMTFVWCLKNPEKKEHVFWM